MDYLAQWLALPDSSITFRDSRVKKQASMQLLHFPQQFV